MNATEYWKNREEGKRGQGERPKGKFTPTNGMNMIRTKLGLVLVNRATARRRRASDPRRTKATTPRMVRRHTIDAQKRAEEAKK